MEHEDEIKRAPGEELEVDFEPEEELGDVGAARAKLKKVRDELAAAKKERQDYLDGWQRAKADAINQRKEAQQNAERAAGRKLEGFIEDLLPALDSFDMASQSESWATIDDGWRSGMEQVKNQLLDALKRHGVERFGKVGEPYDPYIHDVVQEMDDVAGEPGSIVRILRYGYKTPERIIRPAQVIIKKH